MRVFFACHLIFLAAFSSAIAGEHLLLVDLCADSLSYTVREENNRQFIASGRVDIRASQDYEQVEQFCLKFAQDITKVSEPELYTLSRKNTVVCLGYALQKNVQIQYFWDLSGRSHSVQWLARCGRKSAVRLCPRYDTSCLKKNDKRSVFCEKMVRRSLHPAGLGGAEYGEMKYCVVPDSHHTVFYSGSGAVRQYQSAACAVLNFHTQLPAKDQQCDRNILCWKNSQNDCLVRLYEEKSMLFIACEGYSSAYHAYSNKCGFDFRFVLGQHAFLVLNHNGMSPVTIKLLLEGRMAAVFRAKQHSMPLLMKGVFQNVCWEGGRRLLSVSEKAVITWVQDQEYRMSALSGSLYLCHGSQRSVLLLEGFDMNNLSLKEKDCDEDSALMRICAYTKKGDVCWECDVASPHCDTDTHDICVQTVYSFAIHDGTKVRAQGHFHRLERGGVGSVMCYEEYRPDSACHCVDYVTLTHCYHPYNVRYHHVFFKGGSLMKNFLNIHFLGRAYLPGLTKYYCLADIFSDRPLHRQGEYALLGTLVAAKTQNFLDIYLNGRCVTRVQTSSRSNIDRVAPVLPKIHEKGRAALELIFECGKSVFMSIDRKITSDTEKFAIRLIFEGDVLSELESPTIDLSGKNSMKTSVDYQFEQDALGDCRWIITPDKRYPYTFVLESSKGIHSLVLKHNQKSQGWPMVSVEAPYVHTRLSPCRSKNFDGVDMDFGYGRLATLFLCPGGVQLYWCGRDKACAMYKLRAEEEELYYWSSLFEKHTWGKVSISQGAWHDEQVRLIYRESAGTVDCEGVVDGCVYNLLSLAPNSEEDYGWVNFAEPFVENGMLGVHIKSDDLQGEKHLTFANDNLLILDRSKQNGFRGNNIWEHYPIEILHQEEKVRIGDMPRFVDFLNIRIDPNPLGEYDIQIVCREIAHKLLLPFSINELIYINHCGLTSYYSGEGVGTYILRLSSDNFANGPCGTYSWNVERVNSDFVVEVLCRGYVQDWKDATYPCIGYSCRDIGPNSGVLYWSYVDIKPSGVALSRDHMSFLLRVDLPEQIPYCDENPVLFSFFRDWHLGFYKKKVQCFDFFCTVKYNSAACEGPYVLHLLRKRRHNIGELLYTKNVSQRPQYVQMQSLEHQPFALNVSFFGAEKEEIWNFSVQKNARLWHVSPALCFADAQGSVFMHLTI